MDSLKLLDFSSFIIFSDDPWSLLVSFCQLFKLPLVVQCCNIICEWPLICLLSLDTRYLWRSLQFRLLHPLLHLVLVDSRFCWNPLSCQTIKIIRLWSQECWCQCNDEAVCGAAPLKTQVKVKVIIKNKFPVTGWQYYYQNCRGVCPSVSSHTNPEVTRITQCRKKN